MENQKSQLVIEKISFVPHLKEYPQCTFLGYATVDLKFPGALVGGADFRFRISSIEVKILKDTPRIDFKKVYNEKLNRYKDIDYSLNNETRNALTNAIFDNPYVVAAVDSALNLQDVLGVVNE